MICRRCLLLITSSARIIASIHIPNGRERKGEKMKGVGWNMIFNKSMAGNEKRLKELTEKRGETKWYSNMREVQSEDKETNNIGNWRGLGTLSSIMPVFLPVLPVLPDLHLHKRQLIHSPVMTWWMGRSKSKWNDVTFSKHTHSAFSKFDPLNFTIVICACARRRLKCRLKQAWSRDDPLGRGCDPNVASRCSVSSNL